MLARTGTTSRASCAASSQHIIHPCNWRGRRGERGLCVGALPAAATHAKAAHTRMAACPPGTHGVARKRPGRRARQAPTVTQCPCLSASDTRYTWMPRSRLAGAKEQVRGSTAASSAAVQGTRSNGQQLTRRHRSAQRWRCQPQGPAAAWRRRRGRPAGGGRAAALLQELLVGGRAIRLVVRERGASGASRAPKRPLTHSPCMAAGLTGR